MGKLDRKWIGIPLGSKLDGAGVLVVGQSVVAWCPGGFGQVLALRVHCVHTAHAEAGILPKNTCHQSRGWGFLEDPLAPRHKANAQMQ